MQRHQYSAGESAENTEQAESRSPDSYTPPAITLELTLDTCAGSPMTLPDPYDPYNLDPYKPYQDF